MASRGGREREGMEECISEGQGEGREERVRQKH